jgi:regulator of replication initiation timing
MAKTKTKEVKTKAEVEEVEITPEVEEVEVVVDEKIEENDAIYFEKKKVIKVLGEKGKDLIN